MLDLFKFKYFFLQATEIANKHWLDSPWSGFFEGKDPLKIGDTGVHEETLQVRHGFLIINIFLGIYLSVSCSTSASGSPPARPTLRTSSCTAASTGSSRPGADLFKMDLFFFWS